MCSKGVLGSESHLSSLGHDVRPRHGNANAPRERQAPPIPIWLRVPFEFVHMTVAGLAGGWVCVRNASDAPLLCALLLAIWCAGIELLALPFRWTTFDLALSLDKNGSGRGTCFAPTRFPLTVKIARRWRLRGPMARLGFCHPTASGPLWSPAGWSAGFGRRRRSTSSVPSETE